MAGQDHSIPTLVVRLVLVLLIPLIWRYEVKGAVKSQFWLVLILVTSQSVLLSALRAWLGLTTLGLSKAMILDQI